jgi:hypothetical protein
MLKPMLGGVQHGIARTLANGTVERVNTGARN